MTGPGVLFTLVLVLSAAGGTAVVIRPRPRNEPSQGVAVNERISSLAGAFLLVLAAGIGVTVLRIRDLLPEHYLIGFLMLGPLVLKLGSTGYRFARYYTRNPAYRRVGPPHLLLRLSAPILVVATVAVFTTGIELGLFGYRYGTWWFQAHVVSFLVWTAFLGIHLLGHTRRSVEAVAEEMTLNTHSALTGRGLLIASLVSGGVLAVASLLYASPFPPPFGSG
jgi:hypothetical protein